jgi:hypothetical protein
MAYAEVIELIANWTIIGFGALTLVLLIREI